MTQRNSITTFLIVSAATAWLCSSSFAARSLCIEKTAEGEKLVESRATAKAQKVLEEAVKICSAPKINSGARPYVALGNLYFEQNRFAEAQKLFEKALTKEKVPFLHMNIGACQSGLEQYEKSIESYRKALTLNPDKKLQAKLNFNIGYSYFSIASDAMTASGAEKITDRRSEPYFKKASELDPAFGGNFYYLGFFKEFVDQDIPAAKALYGKGCKLGFDSACDFLAQVDQRKSERIAAEKRDISSTTKLSPDNTKLLERVRKAYLKKFSPEAAEPAVQTLMTSCGAVPDANCTLMLENVIRSLQ